MKSHRWVQEQLYDLIRETLDAKERHAVESHLARCIDCRHELEELRSVVARVPQGSYNPSADRQEMFWQLFVQRVERRIAADPDRAPSWVERLRDVILGHRAGFVLGFGSALLVAAAVAGIWMITQNNLTDDARQLARQQSEIPTIHKASLEERTQQYLDRSKILLVGLINTDPREAEKSKMSFSREVEVSKQLVIESRELAAEMNGPSHQRLKRLVTDLELILLQIATLQGELHSPAIEIVKGGVERRDILLKINVEEILRAQTKQQHPKSSKQSI